MKKSYNRQEKGQMLVLAIIVISLVLINTVLIAGGSLLFSQNSNYTLGEAQATNLAEAGLDKALASLNAGGGSYSGEGETSFGAGSFAVTVTTLNASTKQIESTGYIPSKLNPKVKRTAKVNVSRGSGVSFRYGVQVGDGGLEMGNESQVNGSVYTNSNIVMSNNTRISGDVYVAGGTAAVADQQNSCVSPNCSDFVFGKNVSGQNRLDIAQSFRPSVSQVLNKVSLNLKKVGNPSDATVRILADVDGVPDKNSVLATSVLNSGLVTSSYGFVDVVFSSPPSLLANTSYWILVNTTSNSSNYWIWSADTLRSYTNGLSLWSSNWQSGNPNWTDPNLDLDFKAYLGGVDTSILGANGASIGGDAHAHRLQDLTISGGAYYQIKDNVQAGSLHPDSTDPAPQSMPISEGNINAWKDAAQEFGSNGIVNGCPARLEAGVYTAITLSSNCSVTVNTPILITGNFTLGNNDTIRLDSSLQEAGGMIIVEGITTLGNSNSLFGSGTSGSYLMLLSTFNTQTDSESRDAISLTNSGNNGLFYAGQGSIYVSNSNTLREVTAWKLRLGNNVTVDYEQGLASSFFSSGPSGAFSVVKGTYQLK